MIDQKDQQQVIRVFPAFLVLGLVANLGMLVSPLFMMQLLDRVVPSGNMATLTLLFLVAVIFIVLSVTIDAKRLRILREIGLWIEGRYLSNLSPGTAPKYIEDLKGLSQPARFRSFLSAMDIPWAILFAVVLLLLNPLFLIPICVALLGMLFADFVWSGQNDKNTENNADRQKGLISAFQTLGNQRSTMLLDRNLLDWFVDEREKTIASTARVITEDEKSQLLKSALRQIAQISQLAIGGMLVAQSQLSPGGMIAASLIGAKALSLTEAGIGAVASFKSSLELLRIQPERPLLLFDDNDDMSGDIKVEALTVPKGRSGGFRLKQVSFDLRQGTCLAVLGASGSGKSTLIDYLSGAEDPPLGQISIGGNDLKRMDPVQRQKQIGFVPQAPVFGFGTIAENISCFSQSQQSLEVEQAAILAGVHSVILGLPEGYKTDLAKNGFLLSAGQLQKIALARAVFYQPNVLLLDEPNAHQDNLGEQQMADALARVKAAGCTIVMSMHRTGLLWLADQALVLDRGQIADFGDRGSVLSRHSRSNRVIDLPLTIGGVQDVEDWVSAQFQRSGDVEFRYRAILVATELFNYMRSIAVNATEQVRSVRMEFLFISQSDCEIRITEDRKAGCSADESVFGTTADGRYLVASENDKSNMALVLLSKSADNLEFALTAESAQICAKLAA